MKTCHLEEAEMTIQTSSKGVAKREASSLVGGLGSLGKGVGETALSAG
jgi:hypothetical protein